MIQIASVFWALTMFWATKRSVMTLPLAFSLGMP